MCSKYSRRLKMEVSNKLKEIDIKKCTCYYFDDIIKYFDLDNILIDERSWKYFSL